jgi:hypothetical protein
MFDRGGQIFHLLAVMFHLKGQNPIKNINWLIAEVKFGSDEFGIQGRTINCLILKVVLRCKNN